MWLKTAAGWAHSRGAGGNYRKQRKGEARMKNAAEVLAGLIDREMPDDVGGAAMTGIRIRTRVEDRNDVGDREVVIPVGHLGTVGRLVDAQYEVAWDPIDGQDAGWTLWEPLQLARDADVLTEEDLKADRIVEAVRAGEEWAKNLKVGDQFLGCGPEATARGYERETPEYRLFVWSAMNTLDKVTLISTDQGKIVRLERKPQ